MTNISFEMGYIGILGSGFANDFLNRGRNEPDSVSLEIYMLDKLFILISIVSLVLSVNGGFIE